MKICSYKSHSTLILTKVFDAVGIGLIGSQWCCSLGPGSWSGLVWMQRAIVPHLRARLHLDREVPAVFLLLLLVSGRERSVEYCLLDWQRDVPLWLSRQVSIVGWLGFIFKACSYLQQFRWLSMNYVHAHMLILNKVRGVCGYLGWVHYSHIWLS